MSASKDRLPLLLTLLAGTILALVVSRWRPYDRLTWLMEVAPVLIALPLLIGTRERYPLTTLLYVLIFLHGLVLIGGGTYKYARVPAGFWAHEWVGLARNPEAVKRYGEVDTFFGLPVYKNPVGIEVEVEMGSCEGFTSVLEYHRGWFLER